MKKFKVEQKDAGSRLDIFLTAHLKGVSRSRIQKTIKGGQVTVNGKPVTPHLAMEENDLVVLAEMPAASTKKMKMRPRADIALDVVYEDDDVAVVNKPSGLLVHPSPQNEEETLAHALLARWPKIAKVGESTERPGIVHRLDKEASGLLVVAKNKKAYENLKAQFQKHSIKKEYAVLVHGSPAKDEGSVSLAIGRAASGDKMAARAETMEGDRTALTHYRIEEKFAFATLLKVWTETGRTHQIRAHFKALGCPVVGDPLYVLKQGARASSPRLFLHAKKLAFDHPVTGERKEFEAPLPKDLADALKSMKK
ncbi:RluA family pseudouridine synthase [Candidatus Uhrbacteria bacterium]|nr:RluA family pseudouridine synthase [Candidatus Uhrbacteria bacterium]